MRGSDPRPLVYVCVNGPAVREWNYATIERLLEDAADDLAMGRARPLRVLDRDGSVLIDDQALPRRLEDILMLRQIR